MSRDSAASGLRVEVARPWPGRAWQGARSRVDGVRAWARGCWDPGPVLRTDRAAWAAAECLADLAGLTAAGLAGDLDSQPGYYGQVDVDEHLAPGLTDALVALCRAGDGGGHGGGRW